MYTYRVLEECFVDGVLRRPGDDKHNVFTTAKKIEEPHDHLELVDGESKAEKSSRKAAADKLQKEVKQQKEEVKGASFLAPEHKSGGVETL